MSSQKPKKSNTVTTSELAKHLGISRWTVSRILNGHEGVLPETVERVHQGMRELGFQPNALARSLRGGRSRTIGVCFQEIETPILAKKVSILQQLLRDKGYHTLIELTNHQKDLEAEVIRHFLSMQVEAVVLIGSIMNESDPVFLALEKQQVPVVWVDPLEQVTGCEVSIDRSYSIELVLEHLYELGHRKFAILGVDKNVAYGALRLERLHQVCEQLGLSFANDFLEIFEAGDEMHNYGMGYRLAERLLQQKLPSAVITINDRVAIGIMKRLSEAKIQVPEDVSIVGYDNIDVAEYTQPPLTTIDQCATALMQAATDKLLQLLEKSYQPAVVDRTLIKPKLVVRESTS